MNLIEQEENKKSKKNALNQIDDMMHFSNKMENNIQNLNIKDVFEQELNENRQNILDSNALEKFLADKYLDLLLKFDRNFVTKVKKS